MVILLWKCHRLLSVPSWVAGTLLCLHTASSPAFDRSWLGSIQKCENTFPVAQQTAETPHTCGTWFAGELTALVPGCPLFSGCTTAVCAIRFHSSYSSKDSPSRAVAWRLLNARKINEKIPLVVGLSSYSGCPGVTPVLLLVCSAALDWKHLVPKAGRKNE